MNEILILRDKELLVLLAAAGVKGLFGFRQREVAESEIPYLIHELVRKNVVRQENGLVIGEPYSGVIRGIKEAKAVLSVKKGKNREVIAHVYLGKSIIVMTDSVNDTNAVKLFSVDGTILSEFLDEHFSADSQLIYPEELNTMPIQEEEGRYIASLSLFPFGGVNLENRVSEWILYEGRYDYFLKVSDDEGTTYVKYKEWCNSKILDAINELIGE